MTDIMDRLSDPDDMDEYHDVRRAAAAEIKQLREKLAGAVKFIHACGFAIHTTASEGTYDEIAIRQAVSFELAELIVVAREALEEKK